VVCLSALFLVVLCVQVVKKEVQNIVFRAYLCAFLAVFFFIPAKASVFADTLRVKESDASVSIVNGRLIDRFAFKTNALEWLLTIPNFGVEFDLKDSEYNDMTVGLTAKYNWNTYHKYAPPVVFNILDIRPEFRYWYRTMKSDSGSSGKKGWSIDRILKARKNPRVWRAHFVGAYVNYANYTMKFSKEGYQGQVVGLGATAGYALPMYEYKKGGIDVELGFSVGLQMATKDVFVHNPEGYYYSYVKKDERMGFTPFPVVSELKVAFVYRTKSIKDKVKTDYDRRRIKHHYDNLVGDFTGAMMNMTKSSYDENLKNMRGESGMRRVMANDSLYRKGFQDALDAEEKVQLDRIASAFPDEMKNHERRDLRAYVKELELDIEHLLDRAKKSAWRNFEHAVVKYRAELKRAERAEKAAAKAKEVKPVKESGGEPVAVKKEKSRKAEKK